MDYIQTALMALPLRDKRVFSSYTIGGGQGWYICVKYLIKVGKVDSTLKNKIDKILAIFSISFLNSAINKWCVKDALHLTSTSYRRRKALYYIQIQCTSANNVCGICIVQFITSCHLTLIHWLNLVCINVHNSRKILQITKSFLEVKEYLIVELFSYEQNSK